MSGRDASGILGPTVSWAGKAIRPKKPGRVQMQCVLNISPVWSQRHVALTYLERLPRLSTNLKPIARLQRFQGKKRYSHEKKLIC